MIAAVLYVSQDEGGNTQMNTRTDAREPMHATPAAARRGDAALATCFIRRTYSPKEATDACISLYAGSAR